MEKMLIRLARQLDALDEASLMSLWSKYATTTGRFEPTKRWEEAALVFSLIQAKRWKNQLFNYQWATQQKPNVPLRQKPEDALPGFNLDVADILNGKVKNPNAAYTEGASQGMPQDTVQEKKIRSCRVLAFTPSKREEDDGQQSNDVHKQQSPTNNSKKPKE